MASRQESIQRLLAAEEEAQNIVNKARQLKASKLKSSKEQAEREISNYRNTCEQSYQRSVQQRSGDVGANANKLQAETGMKSNAIKAGIERLKPEFVDMLIKSTVNASVV